MRGLTVSAPPDGSERIVQSHQRQTNGESIPKYIVAGTAFDVNSSSCDGLSRRLAIMDAAMDGAAVPVAYSKVVLSINRYDLETGKASAQERPLPSDMVC